MKTPPFPIEPGTELRLNGQLQVVKSIDDNGTVTLMCPLRKTEVQFDLQALVSMRMAGKLEPVQLPPESHQPSRQPTYATMSDDERKRVLRRVAYGRAAAEYFPIGPKNPQLKTLIAEVAERLKDPDPPSPHSVYRWMRRYVGSGYDTSVFMQDAAVIRTRTPRRFSDDLKERLREHIQTLLGAYQGATLHGITNLALARTARDAGYVSFVTKEGVEELVDHFIQTNEASLKKEKPRSEQRSTSEDKA